MADEGNEDVDAAFSHEVAAMLTFLGQQECIHIRTIGHAGLDGDDSAKAPTLASRSSRRADPRGEGSGLAIVKPFCELLDASLELQTEPGNGTTFPRRRL